MYRCCRCKGELDPEAPVALDYRMDGAVCPPCHKAERAYVGDRDFGDGAVRMAEVPNQETW